MFDEPLVTVTFFFLISECAWGGLQNLSTPTKDQTSTPCIGRQSLINNYGIAREVGEYILAILILDVRKPRLKEKK